MLYSQCHVIARRSGATTTLAHARSAGEQSPRDIEDCFAKCARNDEKKERIMDNLYYSDYIELDKILDSQHPKSFSSLEDGNDEMLFIIIHQAYELWFKQILFELDLVRHIFIQDRINDNSDDLSKVVQKLKRIAKILELINQQVSVLETMTA